MVQQQVLAHDSLEKHNTRNMYIGSFSHVLCTEKKKKNRWEKEAKVILRKRDSEAAKFDWEKSIWEISE